MDFDEHAPSSPRAGSCPCRRGHRRGRRRPWSPVGVDRVEVEEVSDDRGGDRELRLFLRSSMGARRTLGRTVGESAVEVSSSRSGRVSSSSSILGPILACSVPSLSGTGGAIVAAKKYRPAPGADQTPQSARHTCGSFKTEIRVKHVLAHQPRRALEDAGLVPTAHRRAPPTFSRESRERVTVVGLRRGRPSAHRTGARSV